MGSRRRNSWLEIRTSELQKCTSAPRTPIGPRPRITVRRTISPGTNRPAGPWSTPPKLSRSRKKPSSSPPCTPSRARRRSAEADRSGRLEKLCRLKRRSPFAFRGLRERRPATCVDLEWQRLVTSCCATEGSLGSRWSLGMPILIGSSIVKEQLRPRQEDGRTRLQTATDLPSSTSRRHWAALSSR